MGTEVDVNSIENPVLKNILNYDLMTKYRFCTENESGYGDYDPSKYGKYCKYYDYCRAPGYRDMDLPGVGGF